MKSKNMGIVVTPHGTIERHQLDIESTVMWGRKDKTLGRPAWLTPNSLRKSKRYSFALLRSTTIDPFALPDEVPIIDKRVKTTQGMTEQYHKVSSLNPSQDSLVILIGLLTFLVVISLILLGLTMPYMYREWRNQNAENDAQQATSFVVRNHVFTIENNDPFNGKYGV